MFESFEVEQNGAGVDAFCGIIFHEEVRLRLLIPVHAFHPSTLTF